MFKLMSSSHLISTANLKPQKICRGGTRTDIKADILPILKGMSLSILRLDAGGFREPHWHPNASELSYCLQGKALLTVFSPGAGHDTFVIEAGDIAFVPTGYIHHIENLSEAPAKFLVCFNHENAEDLDFSAAFGVMSNHILGSTFRVAPQFFDSFHKSAQSVFIGEKNEKRVLEPNYQTNRFKWALEKSQPQVFTKGGWVKMSNATLLPTLDGMALYSLKLEAKGVREPHWHPNASELNFLFEGKAKITILSPGGKTDTFDMQEGDMSFIPQGYFHHIENLTEKPARFAVFFNNSYPSDLGIGGSLGAYPPDLLASLFGVTVNEIDRLPKYQEDLFVVAGGG